MSGFVANTKMPAFLGQVISSQSPQQPRVPGHGGSGQDVNLHFGSDRGPTFEGNKKKKNNRPQQAPTSHQAGPQAEAKEAAEEPKAEQPQVEESKENKKEEQRDSLELRSNQSERDDSLERDHQPEHKDSLELQRNQPEKKDSLELQRNQPARDDAHSQAASLREAAQSDEEPVPVEFNRDQFEADEQMRKHLEWGKRLEPAGRALDWMDEGMKWTRQQASDMAGKARVQASTWAGKAVLGMRKTAANQLTRLAGALEPKDTPASASSSKQEARDDA